MKSIKFLLILFFALISSLSFSQILQNVNKIAGTISKPITQIDSIRFNTSTNQMEIIQTNGNAENHVISDIINVTFSGQLIGTITSLSCGSAIDSGTLTAYIPASNVSSTISYTGGNGGLHNGQTVNSTGVTGLTATLASGSFAVGSGSLIYNITGTPNSNGIASFLINIGGITCILTRIVDLPVGIVSLIDCVNATTTGTLYDGTNASLVSSNISYTGGNGGSYAGQTVSSTGVTGLTATLAPGAFAIGNGSLTYIITGTPDTNGIASFMLNIGGQTCELTINVNLPIGALSVLDCSNASTTGSLIAYSNTTGVNSSIPYSGGNGGLFNSQSLNSTGVTGLTAYIAADTLAIGAGNLIYIISGTPNSAGTASFLINIGGQTCTLSLSVTLPVGTITNLNCGTATNTGTLTAGAASIGVSSSVPYTGGNGGTHNGQTVTSTGVTGLTATLAAGIFTVGAGSLSYTISGTPSAGGTASFALNIGGKTCVLTRTVNLPIGIISTLSCGTATNIGTLTAGTAASGVSFSVPYTGGNGGMHNGQSVASTGVTGLTATLVAGIFSTGAGSLIFDITGTPSGGGSASFALNIGGQACTLTVTVYYAYPAGSIFCNGTPTIVIELTNPVTGKTWMDRNLGATQSSAFSAGYGDLYQWGRRADGHQCRTSPTTTNLSSVDQPVHGNFILGGGSGNNDWRTPQNPNLWQGANGINNPCPIGFRIPTSIELLDESATWSSFSWANTIRFPNAGQRFSTNGVLNSVGSERYYWSSTVSTQAPHTSNYLTGLPSIAFSTRSNGYSVRCIKN
jgi:hypothetical protein